jgi:hypothetical protein
MAPDKATRDTALRFLERSPVNRWLGGNCLPTQIAAILCFKDKMIISACAEAFILVESGVQMGWSQGDRAKSFKTNETC